MFLFIYISLFCDQSNSQAQSSSQERSFYALPLLLGGWINQISIIISARTDHCQSLHLIQITNQLVSMIEMQLVYLRRILSVILIFCIKDDVLMVVTCKHVIRSCTYGEL
jgi:hypothetical protein